jgi:hypothetical protein
MFEVEGTDLGYQALRRPRDTYLASCRAAFEGLIADVAPYLDDDLELRLPADLPSVYWEAHVAAGLRQAGALLVPRVERTPRIAGPDLLLRTPRAWVEAATVSAGEGPDAVPEDEIGVARSVPDDQIILRLTQAITQKRARYTHYLQRGWVAATDPFLVAVNSGTVPSGKAELPLPRIVRAVFPFGHMTLRVDTTSLEVTDSFYQHRPLISKTSGATVSTAMFEDPEFAGVSACIYSTSDAFNSPRSLSRSLVLVHNPLATAPFPRGALVNVREYWREGDKLMSNVTEPA